MAKLLILTPFVRRQQSERRFISFSDWRRPNQFSCVYDPIHSESGWSGIQFCNTDQRIAYNEDFDACTAIVKIPNGEKSSITLLLGLSGFGTYTSSCCLTGKINFLDSYVSVDKFYEFNHQFNRAAKHEVKCAAMLIKSRGKRFEFEELPDIVFVNSFS
jgi:hypothetical protein